MTDAIGTSTSTSDMLNKAATTVGVPPQVKNNLAERAQQIISSTGQLATEWSGTVMDQAAKIPDASRKVAVRIDRHARSNPWLHVGLAGVGFFTLGYFLGRNLSGTNFSIKGLTSKATASNEEDGEQ